MSLSTKPHNILALFEEVAELPQSRHESVLASKGLDESTLDQLERKTIW